MNSHRSNPTARRPRFSTPLRIGFALAIILAPLAAQAYVGPGAGLSLLSALWGLLCAIGAALLFVIMWPIRRLRRRRREARQDNEAGNSPNKAVNAVDTKTQRSTPHSATGSQDDPDSRDSSPR